MWTGKFSRSLLAIILSTILCLIGLFSLPGVGYRNVGAVRKNTAMPIVLSGISNATFADSTSRLHDDLLSFQMRLHTLTPTPELVKPQPDPSPVTPFPLYMQGQVGMLESHNRFFYNGNFALPEVALTFDDGPDPPYTGQILTVLKQYGVNASFFDVGYLVARYPDIVRQEQADGHVIGNHTWSHADLPYQTSANIKTQIGSTSDIIQHVTGVRPVFFRPPYGAFDAHVLTVINQFGLTTFMWNDDPQDWSIPPVSVIVSRVVGNGRNGTIILMHDGGGNRSHTVAALPTIIQELRARGFRFVTLAQLVAHAHK